MAYYLEAARGAVEDNVGYLGALSHELCARFFAEIGKEEKEGKEKMILTLVSSL